MPVADSDPLRIRLRHVQQELRERVDSVCEGPPVEKLNTGELIRFEEALSIVTSAAKEAISLRRRLRADHDMDIVGPGGHERATSDEIKQRRGWDRADQ